MECFVLYSCVTVLFSLPADKCFIKIFGNLLPTRCRQYDESGLVTCFRKSPICAHNPTGIG